MKRAVWRWALGAVIGAVLVDASPVRATGGTIQIGIETRFLYHDFASALPNTFSASKIVVFPGTYHECVNITGLVLLDIVAKKGAILDATGCDGGLTISNGEGITIKGLTIVGAKRGIVVKGAASRILVTKTTIQDPAADPQLAVMETGVQIQGASAVTLDGVTIRGAKTQAVQALLANGMVVRKSTLADSVGAGVALTFATGPVIAKNLMQNLGGPAVLGDGVDALVASNEILFNPGGIWISGTNNVIEKNKIFDSSGAIQTIDGSSASTYRKNTIVRAADAAILAGGNGDTFEKNTIKDALAAAVDVTGDNNVFLGGKVTEAIGTAYLVRDTASGNRFEGCSAAKVGGSGFRVDGTANTFIKAKASGSGGFDLDDPAGAATTNVYTACKFKTASFSLP